MSSKTGSRKRVSDGGGELLKIDQVATRLRVSVGCIRAWRLRGEGPPAIRIGTALRWDAAEVEAWLDSRRESRLDA
ncbi:helix-turn-helix domain-containing protein [Mycolicibacterium austroafricanum]|uniref:helix-turn-helix transcriptional regulator n=1 Tax=Mycolicibacterium austroafricanum TaxID=39687 RepID=UPI00197BBDEA